jgi:hypothetical protein
MVYVDFGPELDSNICAVLEYVAHRLRNTLECFMFSKYNEDEKRLQLVLKPGHWHVSPENIEIKIEETATHPTSCRLVKEIKGHFKAPSIKVLTELFDSAHEYVNNRATHNIKIGTIKCLRFEFGQWDSDATINKRSFSTIHLPGKILSQFVEDVEKFLSAESIEWYHRLEVPHSRVYLLHGPPGTGKTSLIQAIASKYDMSIGSFVVDSKTRDRDLKLCIKRLPKKSILVIEDIDSFFLNRSTTDSDLTYSGVLNAIDGVNRLSDTIIFVTTNYLENIDSALKRRVDYFVKFDFCTKDQVRSIFERFRPDTKFEDVWRVCMGLRLTPSILQKFLIRDLPLDNLSEFSKSEHGLESLPEMYT